MSDSYYSRARVERRRRRRRQVWIRRIIFGLVVLALLAGIIFLCTKLFGDKGGSDNKTTTASTTADTTQAPSESGQSETDTTADTEPAPATDHQDVIDKAERMAAQYDYDGAIDLLKSIQGYESDEGIMAAIKKHGDTKASCTAHNAESISHIFYHSLIVDSKRCWNVSKWGKASVDGYNAWMVTIPEFKECLQELYDAGWVYMNVSDLYTKTTGDNGKPSYSPNTIYLPAGKKPLVISYDDLAYYAQYMDRGFGDKIVLDENGKLKVQYTDASGNTSVGDYDWMPIMDAFVEQHPDAAYKNHKGTIALTGYDGVFGYRTDSGFFSNPTSDEKAWLERHPGVTASTMDQEIADAKIIAQAIKDDGYEFASHSWGHRPMNEHSLDWLKTDTQKWLDRVAPIVGSTDILIYPHGADIAGTGDYTSDNEKFVYLSSAGFHVFCNVDASSLVWNQYRGNYIRMNRINIDGYMLYQQIEKGNTVIGKLGLDADKIFADDRVTPIIANGAG